MKNQIGVYGLGVMGQSLALNLARHNHTVSVFNITYDLTDKLMQRVDKESVFPCKTLSEMMDSLEKPRKILLMVTAGKVVDEVLNQLLKYLEPGDIVIDGGNSYFKDTMKRTEKCLESNIYFIGMGVSGGEKGALFGPCMMPSGNLDAYNQIKEMMESIAAVNDNQEVCCSYIGESGSGHFVKMVHNGIEYCDIEIICECYGIMRDLLKMTNAEISEYFEKWNQGINKSYLFEITSKILKVKDTQTDHDLIDMILDKAGQKGTGKWTSIEALDLGAVAPTIAESVFARNLSAIKNERIVASKLINSHPSFHGNKEQTLKELEYAIYCSRIIYYAQGISLIRVAATQYNWNINYEEIAKIWQAGCIIRADLLKEIANVFHDSHPVNLLQSEYFAAKLEENIASLRNVICSAVQNAVAIPVMSSSLSYYDGYYCANSPINLLQAQRDFFGAHTYERIDKPGSFHTEWEE